MNINRQIVAGNHTPGRTWNGKTYRLQHIVLHTMVGSIGSAQSRFMNPNAGAAAHFGIGLDGEVRQWVSEGDTAWHAGNWAENLISIGIEHEDKGNYNDGVRTDAMYQASIDLIVDIARRNGLSGDFIHIHKEFTATGCPDGLDVARIKNAVYAIMNGQAPANIPARSDWPVQVVSETLEITSATLNVRTEPRSKDDQGNTLSNFGVANTPDGALHAGNTVQITGIVRSEDPYGDGRNLWGRSIHGRFFWLGGTNYYQLHPEALNPTPAPATPQVQPADVPDYTPFDAVATVTAGIGAHVRTGPGTDYPLNPTHTTNAVLNQGETFVVSGYKYAQDPYGDGNRLWVRSQWGNWVWAKNLNVSPAVPPEAVTATAAPAPEPAPEPTPTPEPAPAEPVTEEEVPDEQPEPQAPAAPATPAQPGRSLDGIVRPVKDAAQDFGDDLINDFEELGEQIARDRQSVPNRYQWLNFIGQLVASLVNHLSEIRAFLAFRKAKSNTGTDTDSASTTNNVRS